MINFEWCRTGRNPHIFFSISLLKRCGLGNQAIKRTAQVSYVLNPPLFHHIDRMKFSAGKYQIVKKVKLMKETNGWNGLMDERSIDWWIIYKFDILTLYRNQHTITHNLIVNTLNIPFPFNRTIPSAITLNYLTNLTACKRKR